MSSFERHKVDVGRALAVIHHILTSNNVPLVMIAEFFSTICESLIIEFVPKSDSQVKRMLATREDIFKEYDQSGFDRAFSGYFSLLKSETIKDSARTLHLFKRHD